MTNGLSKDDLRHLLRAAKPSKTTTSPSYVDRREDWLKAAATCARLLLYPPQDEGFQFLVGADVAVQLTESPASNLVASYRDKLGQQSVSVLGIHFLDKLVGRWSRIWVSQRWPSAVYPNVPITQDTDGTFKFLGDVIAKSEATQRKHFTYSWLFSHLWMRAYWRELHTTATLINAFHDGILSWNQPLHFRWDATNAPIELPGHGTVAFKGDDAGKDFQGIADEFAAAIHGCIQGGGTEFSNVLKLFTNSLKNKAFRSDYLTNLRALSNQIHQDLSTRAVLKRFSENPSRVRQVALADDKWHEWLSGSIKVISGTEDLKEIEALYSRYHGNTPADKHIFLEDAWDKSQSWIEAVYSATINGVSFTGNSGFTLNRISVCGEELRAYVVVGLYDVNDMLGQVLRDIYEYLHEVVQLAYEEYVKSERKLPEKKAGSEAVTAKKADVSEVSHEIVDIANRLHVRVRNWAEPHAVQRWLQVIKSLADQSIHEGLETKYLLGCGPAYISRVRGRLYEPAPDHLLSDSSKGEVASVVWTDIH